MYMHIYIYVKHESNVTDHYYHIHIRTYTFMIFIYRFLRIGVYMDMFILVILQLIHVCILQQIDKAWGEYVCGDNALIVVDRVIIARSPTHSSFTQPHTHSVSLTNSFSLTLILAHSLIHSLTHSFSLTLILTHSLTPPHPAVRFERQSLRARQCAVTKSVQPGGGRWSERGR